ncbi:hypothetical protein V6Z12_A12G290700 [Gossypium hirsutum]
MGIAFRKIMFSFALGLCLSRRRLFPSSAHYFGISPLYCLRSVTTFSPLSE